MSEWNQHNIDRLINAIEQIQEIEDADDCTRNIEKEQVDLRYRCIYLEKELSQLKKEYEELVILHKRSRHEV